MSEENVPTGLSAPLPGGTINEVVAGAYEKLKQTVIRNFGRCTWFNVEACCSVIATLSLKDAPNPVGLLLINPPASGKTTVLSMFWKLPMVYRSDSFTPAAMVSNAANIRSEKRLREIDLLPKIKNKCIIVKDMASIFAQDKDQLQKSLATLTNVFDGEGYKTDTGAHGSRGYADDHHFALIAATPPIPDRVSHVMNQMGSRLIQLSAEENLDQLEEIAQCFADVFDSHGVPYKEKVAECRQSVTEFFEVLSAEFCPEGFARSIKWNGEGDCIHLKFKINLLAAFVARARSKVAIKEPRGKTTDEFDDFTQPQHEKPRRLASLLYEMAQGSAICHGRMQIAPEDMPLVVEIALSSMHQSRRQVIDLVLQEPSTKKQSERGSVTSSEITNSLIISRPKALKVLKELELLGLGTLSRTGSTGPATFSLNQNYDWLLSDEFASLRRPWERTD